MEYAYITTLPQRARSEGRFAVAPASVLYPTPRLQQPLQPSRSASFLTLTLFFPVRHIPLTTPHRPAYTPDPSVYLSDSHGRSVTPIILPPSDDDAFPEEQKELHDRYGISPLGNSRDEMEASRELEKLRRRKKEVESGLLGRESSKLVNGKRRRGFLDGEEFWDVFDE